jgi:hypothetical protein
VVDAKPPAVGRLIQTSVRKRGRNITAPPSVFVTLMATSFDICIIATRAITFDCRLPSGSGRGVFTFLGCNLPPDGYAALCYRSRGMS